MSITFTLLTLYVYADLAYHVTDVWRVTKHTKKGSLYKLYMSRVYWSVHIFFTLYLPLYYVH